MSYLWFLVSANVLIASMNDKTIQFEVSKNSLNK